MNLLNSKATILKATFLKATTLKAAFILPLVVMSAQALADRPYSKNSYKHHSLNHHSNQNQILDELQYQVDQRNWNEAKEIIIFYQNADTDKGSFTAYQVEKIDVLVSQVLKDEKPLFDQLKRNFSEHLANEYLTQYPYGIYHDQVHQLLNKQDEKNDWERANSKHTYHSYNRYLKIYPNGQYASKARNQLSAIEAKEYKQAVSSNTPSAYNKFLNRYPNSQYASDIHERLNVSDQEYDYNQAITYNSISEYENFLNKYPSGPFSEEIRNRLKNEYLDRGDYAYSGKNYLVAKENYEKFLRLNTDPTLQKQVQAKVNISKKYAHRRGGMVSMFTMDSSKSAGFTFAHLDTTVPGFYVSMKIKPETINAESFDTIDDNGIFTGRNPGTATGQSKTSRFSIATGMTYQFKYPIWGYMGAGFEFRSQYDEVETTDIFDETEFVWVENTDQNKVYIAPEVGFILKQENFVLNYGVRYTDEIIHQVGLGMVY